MTYDEEKKVADVIVAITERINALESENDRLLNLTSDLRLQAQTHAMEARTANSTIHEIYQIISGGKGEPANWQGAKPVREYVEAAKGEILRLETELALSKPVYSRRQLESRAEAAEAEVKHYRVALIAAKTRMRNCRGAIESGQVVDKDVHGSLQNGISDIQEALASTGGEHHAE